MILSIYVLFEFTVLRTEIRVTVIVVENIKEDNYIIIRI